MFVATKDKLRIFAMRAEFVSASETFTITDRGGAKVKQMEQLNLRNQGDKGRILFIR